MSWRDRYQKGRFRNAPFVTEAHDLEGGRRVAAHQYPQRDLPYPEDLGRMGRTFSLDLFVRGENYMDARDALLEAIEAEGPGTLVHPYLGTMRVQVQTYRLRESTRDGGMARFTVQFLEAGDNHFPASSRDTSGNVRNSADNASGVIQEVFADEFSTEGEPEWLSERAESLGQKILDQLSVLSNAAPAGALKTDFLADIASVSGDLGSLVRTPATLGGSLYNQVAALGRMFTDPLAGFGALKRLFTFGSDLQAVPTTTASRRQQDRNQDALVKLTRQAGVIEAARLSADIEFPSFDEAVEVRETLAGELDTQMLTADDTVYPALQELRAAAVRDITARGADLARVVDYTPRTTLPALVIAHQLYGDARQESAIISRNARHIRHPGFVPGGDPLEVLTSVS